MFPPQAGKLYQANDPTQKAYLKKQFFQTLALL
jgi:hypothetical protein